MISAPLRVSAPNGAVGFTTPPSSSSSSRPTRIRCAAAPAGRGASTLYEELGLRAGATVREIKAAYRRLARERHPDVAGAPAAADFVRLHHAYATLSDPDTRARYDRAAVPMPMMAGRTRRTWETDQCW
ncbi:hypothetical protein PR202_gb02441 [Eleusine coracana subsp. coracana]|uniref:J domain-containing protein n=1 Tax=Eleusine coracana subsp. coracana TaxID=191504 RepID=A0AAV5E050_ELECO|nr:hypothetical protein PR202_gb02441 [Eleusine coracana subsp. coracana]